LALVGRVHHHQQTVKTLPLIRSFQTAEEKAAEAYLERVLLVALEVEIIETVLDMRLIKVTQAAQPVLDLQVVLL
jgi:hypothetical protein